MKTSIRLLATFLLLGVLAGSASAQSKKPNAQLKFAFSVMIMDNPYFVAVKKGFEDRC
jgi:ABC-type sugar transport system substrate-binding protein